ncbi:MAG: glycosyltransferase, partial [Gemmatimonas sp.]
MTILATTAAGSLGAILLIWIGYPIAVWGLALVIRRPIRPDYERARSRRVSVVLATREHAAIIEARVSNLLDTEHPSSLIDVIVALDAEGARATRESLGHLDPRVHAVGGDAPGGKAATLNAGVRAAAGDVLIMADSAQRFDRRTIPELVACLEDERFAAVSGALSLGDRGGRSPVHAYWRMEKWLRYNESLLHSSIGVTGAVYATRRTAWPVIPPGTLLDDVFVPMSLVLAGHRVGFT